MYNDSDYIYYWNKDILKPKLDPYFKNKIKLSL
jgi:hypothetical protein